MQQLVRPASRHLGEHGLAEPVSGAGERESHVGVKALERAGVARAADPQVERGAAVRTGLAGRELVPQSLLLRGRPHEVVAQGRVGGDGVAPALDPARGLQPRDGRDEVPAGEVVRRREGLAVGAYGSCSVTAGRPQGQRATTRRNVRGSRPSWQSDGGAIVHALTVTVSADGVLTPPLVGALDDEEVLPRPHVADPTCRPGELVEARGALEPCGHAGALSAEIRDLGPPLVELVAGLEVRVDRPDVEERDDAEHDDAAAATAAPCGAARAHASSSSPSEPRPTISTAGASTLRQGLAWAGRPGRIRPRRP